ncbi:hypothetical protein ABK040_002458 [Willaertia magna]
MNNNKQQQRISSPSSNSLFHFNYHSKLIILSLAIIILSISLLNYSSNSFGSITNSQVQAAETSIPSHNNNIPTITTTLETTTPTVHHNANNNNNKIINSAVKSSFSTNPNWDDVHRVLELPGYGPINQQDEHLYSFSGYLSIHPTFTSSNNNNVRKGSLFYWFFGRNTSSTITSDLKRPILLWLQGGPSASSMIGNFEEFIGPFSIIRNSTTNYGSTNNNLNTNNNNNEGGNNENYYLKFNPEASWIEHSDLLFIDQPIGTGFSYVENNETFATTGDQVSLDLYNVLLNFFDRYPQFKDRKLILSGESYAGHYLPKLSERIFIQNVNENINHLKHQVAGIMIGDGFTSPIIQRNLKAEQAYWEGLISFQQLLQVRSLEEECIRHIKQGNTIEPGSACEEVKSYLLIASGIINIYDIRNFSPSTDKPRLEAYLNQKEVRKAIHADEEIDSKGFCKDFMSTRHATVYQALKSDILIDLRDLVAKSAEKTRVLIYAGNFDLQDGPVQIERYLLSMGNRYENIRKWKEAPRNLWFVNDTVAGYEKSSNNLSFITVFGNGHFVHNQKRNMKELLKRFITQLSTTVNDNEDSGRDLSFCSESETIPVKFKTLTPSNFLKYLFDEKLQEYRIPCRNHQLLCTTLLKNCHGHGTCKNGYCKCKDGYTGESCEHRLEKLSNTNGKTSHELKQQEWYFVKVEKYTKETPYFIVSANWNNSTMITYDVNLDTVTQPTSKVCLLVRKSQRPNARAFDAIQCKERPEEGPLVIVLNSTFASLGNGATTEEEEDLYIAVFNTHQYQIQFSLHTFIQPSSPYAFDTIGDVTSLQLERDIAVGAALFAALIAITTTSIAVYLFLMGKKRGNENYHAITAPSPPTNE